MIDVETTGEIQNISAMTEQATETLSKWSDPTFWAKLLETITPYLFRALSAILVLIIGFFIVAKIRTLVEKTFAKTNFDPAVEAFLESLLSMLLKIVVVLAALNIIGVPMASFLAILGAAGLAVGLALQGSLANFAGGVLILVFKPFKIGDYINADEREGTVKSITIMATTLLTPDNKTIIIPNGGLANTAISNYSMQKKRRVDFVIGIDYSDDIDKARTVLEKIIKAEKRVLTNEEVTIVVAELGDNSVNFKIRIWTKTADYWGVYFDTLETIKKTFDKEGLHFPFPQRNVYLHQV
jgi:small conductance mechanosensitive channel